MTANYSSDSEDLPGVYYNRLELPAADATTKTLFPLSANEQSQHPLAIRLQLCPSESSADAPFVSESKSEEPSFSSTYKDDMSAAAWEGQDDQDYDEGFHMGISQDTSPSNSSEKLCHIGKEASEQTLVFIEKCESEILTRSTELLNACDQYCKEQTSCLSHLKKCMQNAVNFGLAEAKGTIMDWKKCEMSLMGSFVAQSCGDSKHCSLFKCEEQESDCAPSALLGVSWRSGVDTRGRLIEPEKADAQPLNPLCFSDSRDFVAAARTARTTTDVSELQYYKAMCECLEAKEEAYNETLLSQSLSSPLVVWTQHALHLFRSKVALTVPDSEQRDLADRVAIIYRLLKEEERLKNLQPTAAPEVSPHLLQVPKKRRGRPPSSGNLGGRESIRKQGKSHFSAVTIAPFTDSETHSTPLRTNYTALTEENKPEYAVSSVHFDAQKSEVEKRTEWN